MTNELPAFIQADYRASLARIAAAKVAGDADARRRQLVRYLNDRAWRV